MAKISGFSSPGDILGKLVHDLFDQAMSAQIEAADNRCITSGEDLFIEEEGHALNKQKAIYLTKKSPLRDKSGNIIGVLGVSFDITERKKMEEDLKIAKEKAEIASVAKTEFIVNMNHDLKTPLAGIISLAESLSHRLTGEDQLLAESLLQSGVQLFDFIKDCVEISKIEGNTEELEQETFEFKTLIENIHDLFQPTITAKQLEMHINIDSRLPAIWRASRSGMYRVLINLVGNAIKFTDNGTITIGCRLLETINNKNLMIQFSIKDTGIGIAKEHHETIFERFTRVSPTYKSINIGSGLGLYIAQSFARKMGGDIHVESSPGHGSDFTLTLPITIPRQIKTKIKHVATNKIPAKMHPTSLSPLNVLLVEDNLIAQRAARTLLSSLQCNVETAGSGEEAIAVFEPGKYDIAFIDIGLPNIQGHEVAQILREKENNTPHRATIIALTAHVQESSRDQYLSSGIDDILSKPLLREKAKQIILDRLGHHSLV